MNPFKK